MIKKILKKLQKFFVYTKREPIYITYDSGENKLLKNKTVFITGGVSGIGYAIAQECLRNGAHVIITSRSEDRLISAVSQLKAEISDNIKGIILDISDIENSSETLKDILNENDINVLINNAGIMNAKAFGQTDEEEFQRILNTNLKGTYFISQTFAKYFINRKIEGNILNISSVSGIRPAISPYMISKWGEVGFTKGMAKQLIKYGIVVNGIAPGPTATAMLGKDGSDLTYEKCPAKRYVAPIEVANLAVFLISNMGRMIIGETICISGGLGNLTYDDIAY